MRASGGFTLVETMVALLIVALAVAAAVQLTGRSADEIRAMREAGAAHWVAANRLAALRAAGAWPSLEAVQGQSEQAGRRWYWFQTASNGPAPGLRTVDIRVRTAPEGPERARLQGVFARVLSTPQAPRP